MYAIKDVRPARLALHDEPLASAVAARRLYDKAMAAMRDEYLDPFCDAERLRCLTGISREAERLMSDMAQVVRPGSTTPTPADANDRIARLSVALLSWGVIA